RRVLEEGERQRGGGGGAGVGEWAQGAAHGGGGGGSEVAAVEGARVRCVEPDLAGREAPAAELGMAQRAAGGVGGERLRGGEEPAVEAEPGGGGGGPGAGGGRDPRCGRGRAARGPPGGRGAAAPRPGRRGP